MASTGTNLEKALLVDYTGKLSGFRHLERFDDRFIRAIRHPENSEQRYSLVVIVDQSVDAKTSAPSLVQDHVNLTGTNPFVGPNSPGGERFPVVQDIYVVDCLKTLPRVTLAGLKQDVVPTVAEEALLSSFGVEAASYNIVPSMLIAAHAKVKVLAVVVPKGIALPAEIVEEIKQLTGEKK